MLKKPLVLFGLLTGMVSVLTAQVQVKRLTIPPAGEDRINISMSETYQVEGIGTDTVNLTGVLVTRRGAPLLTNPRIGPTWANSTVIAEFTELTLQGKSEKFGDVTVTLDKSKPTFASVIGGHCRAAVQVNVKMSKLDTEFRTAEAVQLTSRVTTIPPIGDQKTTSVGTTQLVDASGRNRGQLVNATVVWRTLVEQRAF